MPGPEFPSESQQKVAQRGKVVRITAQKRAAQYQGEYEVRGDDQMWCRHCGVHVKHADASVAKAHLKSMAHKRHKTECPAINLKPGPTAQLVDAPAAPASVQTAAPVATPVQKMIQY